MERAVTVCERAGAAQPLFVEFVNTLHWFDGAPIELLGDESALSTWLAEHALPTDNYSATLSDLLALRPHVRAIIEALAGGQANDAPDLDAVQRALAHPTGRLVLRTAGDARPRLAFEADGQSDSATFRVALSVARFLEAGERHRLKLCANPGCGFAFLDTSMNNTRRWCFMRFCGNRDKARAFRRRKQAGKDRGRQIRTTRP
jgi:predicted RNA-binding Zn ribbon-like protein